MVVHSDDVPNRLPVTESDPAHEGGAAACRDCGHPLSAGDRFCGACGQPTQLHPPTLQEFVHDWLLHYVALEGKLWKSLWALMARPGFLTLEYLAGRRQRYVHPVRLLLTFGLLFFLCLKLVPGLDPDTIDLQLTLSPASPASAAEAATAADTPGIQLSKAWAALVPDEVQRRIEAARARALADPQAELRRLGNAMLGMAPYAVLVSLPFFAGLVKLLFRPMPFGAHFVFAMHLHAAWYGLLLLAWVLPSLWAALAVLIWAILYPVLALRRVHGIGWGLALGKSTMLAMLHLLVILLGVIGLILLGVTLDG